MRPTVLADNPSTLRALLSIGLAICSPSLARAPVSSPKTMSVSLTAAERQGVEAEIRAQMKRRAIPGLQIAIVRHGRIVFFGGGGNRRHAKQSRQHESRITVASKS